MSQSTAAIVPHAPDADIWAQLVLLVRVMGLAATACSFQQKADKPDCLLLEFRRYLRARPLAPAQA